SLPYLSSKGNENLLGIYFLNEKTGVWEYVGGKVNMKNKRIDVTLNHFSTYAVMEWTGSFADVAPSHWVASAVKVLSAKHIVSGKSEMEFSPRGVTTRVEFVTMITKLLGLKASNKESAFTDVNGGDASASAVQAAYEANIISGRSVGKFAPNESITREEMAIMLVRAYAFATGKSVQSNYEFKDNMKISNWAKNEVAITVKLGIMSGVGNNMFNPKSKTTRAETAMAVYNLMNVMEAVE
ncbi:MAG: S-layer homology domain-containing protein, partial [Gorillibacterium sp.]|nr:S-layer homology domain-containing protein [Gorillibacterium sp.]